MDVDVQKGGDVEDGQGVGGLWGQEGAEGDAEEGEGQEAAEVEFRVRGRVGVGVGREEGED